jgi:phosphoribulokinase
MAEQNFKDMIAASPRIFVLGVAGDSGSGKTTFTMALRAIFGADLVTRITLDDYHKYDREERAALGITALHPDANRLAELMEDIVTLRKGGLIKKPVYDHATGSFRTPVPFKAGKILILEGLHTLYTPEIRSLLDFSVFVEPDTDVKHEWKIRRDVDERGYRREDVLREIAEREPDYRAYIAPQLTYADAVIRIRYSKYGRDIGISRNVYQVSVSQVQLMGRETDNIDLAIDLHAILSLAERDFSLEFIHGLKEGRNMGDLIIDGEPGSHVVRSLETSIERQTRVHPITVFSHRDYVTATELAQLVLCWRIIHCRISHEICRGEASPNVQADKKIKVDLPNTVSQDKK